MKRTVNMVALGNKIKNNNMKFTWTQYGIIVTIDEEDEVTLKKLEDEELDKYY